MAAVYQDVQGYGRINYYSHSLTQFKKKLPLSFEIENYKMRTIFTWMIENFYNKNPFLRKIIMRLLFKDKNCSVNIFNRELIINSIKENGYYRASRLCSISGLLRDEISVILNISAIINTGDTFVDVGANVGIFSSLLSRYKSLIPNFDIYAFEANYDTYIRLVKNAQQHGFHAYNIAISDREGELEFVEGAVSHVFTTLENASRYNFTHKLTKVKCERLDKLDIEGKSIILKIDVEGQEIQVLKGAKLWFDKNRIKAVYIDGFSDTKGVIDFLQSYGFSLWDGQKLIKSDGNIFSLLAIAPQHTQNERSPSATYP